MLTLLQKQHPVVHGDVLGVCDLADTSYQGLLDVMADFLHVGSYGFRSVHQLVQHGHGGRESSTKAVEVGLGGC